MRIEQNCEHISLNKCLLFAYVRTGRSLMTQNKIEKCLVINSYVYIKYVLAMIVFIIKILKKESSNENKLIKSQS